MSAACPIIALTMGDPAGIGPELVLKTACSSRFNGVSFIIYGVPWVIKEAARRFTPGFIPEICPIGDFEQSSWVPGKLNPAGGLAAYRAVEQATRDALASKVDAVVTAPLNKAAINEAGIKFTGHTELIAEICKCNSFAMMQSAGDLRVVFVTTHIPLNQVAKAITVERIFEVTHLLESAVKQEGVIRPKLAMAAINPHAGEDGFMGDEDELVVKPAIALLNCDGVSVDGPYPPDTLFIASTLAKYDGIISMYHDQGHIPFKMLAFDRGVNSTLGLPIIRTSPDHGTAFNIAWQSIADTGSIFAATELAIKRVRGGTV